MHKNKTMKMNSSALPRWFASLTSICALLALGSGQLWAAPTVETFTTAGTSTWVCPAGVTSVQVECWGGGGQGGGAKTYPGGGGAGGAYARLNNYSVTAGSSYTVHVGYGGSGAAGTVPGQAGDDSTFSTPTPTVVCRAKGGGGGINGTAAAFFGAGGTCPTGSVGDVINLGGSGAAGAAPAANNNGGGGGSSGGTSSVGNTATNITGAAAVTGGGLGGNGSTGSQNGNPPASGPGGGGGGSSKNAGTGTSTGGAGFLGQVRLTYAVTLTSTFTWTNLAGGDWANANNWLDHTVADGSGVAADFSTLDLTADTTVSLTTARTIGSLIFGDTDTNTAAGWTLDNGGNGANTLNLAGDTPTVTVLNLALGKSVTISAVIASDSLTKSGAGPLTLSGANTYSGGTTVNDGTLRITGSLAGGAVNVNGGTLGGSGVINGPVIVNGGAVLAPGNGGISRLTINNSLVLVSESETVMNISKAAGTNDVVTGLTSVNYDGTLTVNNLAGNLAYGNSFPLFSAISHTGGFATLSLPALTNGLAWAWNPTNGTLTVASNTVVPPDTNTSPGLIRFALNGGNLNLSWDPAQAGWMLQSNSVNLADPDSWYNVPNTQQGTNFLIPMNASSPQVFYRLRAPMNILFMLADDWRYNTLGCAGNPVVLTPNLDSLASEGLRFSHACVVTAVCWHSRANIFTGQTTPRYLSNGTQPNDSANILEPQNWVNTFPALLRSHGYWIGHVGKWHNGNFPTANYDYGRAHNGGDLKHWYDDGNGGLIHETTQTGSNALVFLRTRPANKPFCLTMAPFAPHAWDSKPEQYLPLPETTNLYVDVTVPVPVNATDESFYRLPSFISGNPNNTSRTRWAKRFDTPAKYQIYMKNYYRLCTGVDTMFGRVLDELRQQGVLDNTLIIMIGDNGYYHAEHGLADKWYAHQESIRVPLIIRDPRMPTARRGQTNDVFALNIDLAPTILTAAGIPVPGGMQGSDLAPLYLAPTPPVWRTNYYYDLPLIGSDIPGSEALVEKDWKYIYWTDYATEQLFHLATDPIEEVDLINDPASAAQLNAMRARFAELKAAAK